jgi:protein-S-isoprenylcysteine O-methyltransferase Ste14
MVLRQETMNPLIAKAFISLAVLMGIMAALILFPAGTPDFWQAWTFLGVYCACSLAITLYLMRKDPKLLQRRMSGGPIAEKNPTQKIIMILATLSFAGLLVVPGLDHRFGWSHLSVANEIVGDALVILGFLGVARVFKENSFTSATIEVAEDQRVISTGPYAHVRHPMYAAALIMILGIPIALGSYVAVICFVTMVAVVVWRLLDEEQYLAANLPGYAEYRRHVRFRLIPGVW